MESGLLDSPPRAESICTSRAASQSMQYTMSSLVALVPPKVELLQALKSTGAGSTGLFTGKGFKVALQPRLGGEAASVGQAAVGDSRKLCRQRRVLPTPGKHVLPFANRSPALPFPP